LFLPHNTLDEMSSTSSLSTITDSEVKAEQTVSAL
jgi:hypothetical protein